MLSHEFLPILSLHLLTIIHLINAENVNYTKFRWVLGTCFLCKILGFKIFFEIFLLPRHQHGDRIRMQIVKK